MPLLTPRDVHLDAPLTNLTLAEFQSDMGFVADKVFPVVDVSKQSDKYYKYDRANYNRDGDVQKLAPRTEVPTIGMAVSNDSYLADVYGLGMDFDEQTIANEDTALETRAAGAATLMNRLRIDREVKWASTYFAASVWGSESTPANLWSDYTLSTPITDITTARRTMQLKSGGFKPNTMVVGKEVRDILINHPDILARLNGGSTVTNTALITDAKLAEIFEVENFYVMEAVKNDSAEGVAESNSFIGGKHCLLVHTPRTAGIMVPAAGLTFAWNSIPGASQLGITVESFSGDWLRVKQIEEKIQVKMAYDHKVTGADLGYFFASVVA